MGNIDILFKYLTIKNTIAVIVFVKTKCQLFTYFRTLNVIAL